MFNNNGVPVYGYGYANPQPKARMTQPLTDEQIAKLQQTDGAFSMKVDQEDLWRSACTHKRKDNGMSTLVQNTDGSYTCTICHETFNLCDSDKSEIEGAVKTIVDMLQTIKTVYLDAPEELIVQYMQQIPLLKKMPQLWDRAMKNFALYDNTMNPLNPINNPGMSSFAAMQNLLYNPYAFNPMGATAPMAAPYGYQQQPMMASAPVAAPMAAPYGYQQPMMDPNANPMAYGYPNAPVAPMPGVMPGMAAPQVAQAPVAAAPQQAAGEVQQQQVFNV